MHVLWMVIASSRASQYTVRAHRYVLENFGYSPGLTESTDLLRSSFRMSCPPFCAPRYSGHDVKLQNTADVSSLLGPYSVAWVDHPRAKTEISRAETRHVSASCHVLLFSTTGEDEGLPFLAGISSQKQTCTVEMRSPLSSWPIPDCLWPPRCRPVAGELRLHGVMPGSNSSACAHYFGAAS